MKKFTGLLVGLIMMTMMLAACGNDDSTNKDAGNNGNNESTTEEATNNENDENITETRYQPEAIDPNNDVCEICAMAVADEEHATQIVLKNDRSLKFDDLGCLYKWLDENGEDDVGAKFVRDFHTEDWVLIEDATYVFDEAIETPMAYGIISFKDEADATAYIDEHEIGEILQADDLQDHKWQMMDHEHGDHDEHDEHDNHNE